MNGIDLDDMTVSDIMRRWPSTIAVFLELELDCVGCPIGPLHTLEDAAQEHALPVAVLNDRVRKAIAEGLPQ